MIFVETSSGDVSERLLVDIETPFPISSCEHVSRVKIACDGGLSSTYCYVFSRLMKSVREAKPTYFACCNMCCFTRGPLVTFRKRRLGVLQGRCFPRYCKSCTSPFSNCKSSCQDTCSLASPFLRNPSTRSSKLP